jgi:hypothetical protein
MPKLDNEPCGVSVPVDYGRWYGHHAAGWCAPVHDFSVWLTNNSLQLVKAPSDPLEAQAEWDIVKTMRDARK